MKQLTSEQWAEIGLKFQVGNYLLKPVYVEYRGNNKWAVVLSSGDVLSKEENGFVYDKPNPSSRTNEFLEDTRFDSKDEAYSAWRQMFENPEQLKKTRL